MLWEVKIFERKGYRYETRDDYQYQQGNNKLLRHFHDHNTLSRTNIRTYESMNTRTYEHTNVRTHERTNTRTHERTNLRPYELSNVRTYVCKRTNDERTNIPMHITLNTLITNEDSTALPNHYLFEFVSLCFYSQYNLQYTPTHLYYKCYCCVSYRVKSFSFVFRQSLLE